MDYSTEPTTLVVFDLAEGGHPPDRLRVGLRSAFTANEGGWGMVVRLIDKYLVQTS